MENLILSSCSMNDNETNLTHQLLVFAVVEFVGLLNGIEDLLGHSSQVKGPV